MDGWVYFIAPKKSPFVKIGYSRDPDTRLACLQTAHFEELRILAAIPGTIETERDLHRRFYGFRVQGEWYRRRGELDEYIKTLPSSTITPRSPSVPLIDDPAERLKAVDAMEELLGGPEVIRKYAEAAEHVRGYLSGVGL